MKKTFFLRLMTVAMMAVVCMTFTACGGDDDSTPAGGGVGTGGGTVTEADWVDLYMNWDTTMDQVKAYVTGLGWTLVGEANKVQTYSSNSRPNVILNYGAPYTATLATAQAIYNNSSEDFYKWCIEKVKTAYSATVNTNGISTGGVMTINGWTVQIIITYAAATKMTTVQFNATEKTSTGGGGSGNNSEVTQSDYINPYVSWSASIDDIKTTLTAQNWEVIHEDAGGIEFANSTHPNVTIVYAFREQKLREVRVLYENCPKDFYTWAVGKIQSDCQTTSWNEEVMPSGGSFGSGQGTVDGKKVNIDTMYVLGTKYMQETIELS